MLISLVTWITTGKRQFAGPEIVHPAVIIEGREPHHDALDEDLIHEGRSIAVSTKSQQ